MSVHAVRANCVLFTCTNVIRVVRGSIPGGCAFMFINYIALLALRVYGLGNRLEVDLTEQPLL